MESDIDFTKYREPELVELFGRLDPRYAPANCARLKDLLIERGYLIYDGGVGPGAATPSPAKLQELIGSPSAIVCKVIFGESAGLFARLEPAHNDFYFVGSGTLEADGIYLRLSGRRAGPLTGPGLGFRRHVDLIWHGIVDVESDENVLHFSYRAADSPTRAITLWFPDRADAERLVAVLPTERTEAFRPQLKTRVDFERNLIAQSPRTPVSVGLVAINALLFLVTALSGRPLLDWGSNFGPYTTDGEWWRLLTALFLHIGVIHLLGNMWALASFGPLVERLYGSVNYLLLYLLSGVAGSLASISWHPDTSSVGASGAIFGILGALLAAQWRVGRTFPGSVVRPLRSYTLMFTTAALLAGLAHVGIDNAAHMGGLGAGFLMGLAMAHPVTGERANSSLDVQGLLKLVPLAAVLFAGGLWFAQRATGSLLGEGLYWHTVHWLTAAEHTANIKYKAALAVAGTEKNELAVAKSVDNDELPFWREASKRIIAIHLRPGSPNLPALDMLRTLCDRQFQAYQHYSAALRRNDPQEIAAARLELKQVRDFVNARD